MTCPFCNAIDGHEDGAECRALAAEMRANAEALRALRDESLPPLAVAIPRRVPVYSWLAAAAVVLFAAALPLLRHVPSAATPPRMSEPLKIKMLTPDPDVVIYWLIDRKEGESR